MPASASKKSKPVGDRTRTARAAAHLERLGAAKGKRVVVDLGRAERQALDALLASGYAPTQSDVIRKALKEAELRQPKQA